ncbi:hypothetical protein FA13DRAFT_1111014 [Coprinellus micaceus]|uniref:Uncharacterized protein n=1 Tax=Coprinellus micaceus TaxID=71717 RepID=A0A4Y7SWT1_COPMI|nr:hypothetical protein FA13DRAFT_1111014 [Coprinellus micaceus]
MSSYHEQQGQHNQPQPRPSTSSIGKISPLNPGSGSAPTTPGLPAHNTPFARPGSRGSLNLMASAASGPGQQAGQGTSGFSRMANEELRALSGPYPNGLTSGLPPTPGSRGSMILYRRADSFTTNGAGLAQGPMAPEEGNRYTLHFPADGGNGGGGGANGGFLPPPPIGGGGHGGSNRGSMYSVSGDSIASMGMGDSKYPPSLFAPGTPGTPIRTTGSGLRGPFQGLEGRGTSGWGGADGRGSLFSDGRTSVAFSLNGMGGGGLVAYAYDPDEEDLSEDDEDDWLHDPEVAYPKVCLLVVLCWGFEVSSPASFLLRVLRLPLSHSLHNTLLTHPLPFSHAKASSHPPRRLPRFRAKEPRASNTRIASAGVQRAGIAMRC